MSAPSERCSASALEADEPLAASAPYAVAWVALEQPGPWGRGALEQSHLPAEIGVALAESLGDLPMRIVLIRRPGRHADAGPAAPRRLYVAGVRPGQAWLAAADLADPAQVLDLDLTALAEGAPAPGWMASCADPVALVCTNAQRDLCCAEQGRPLALALAADGLGVWESSHLGGHRFAPTAVVLPSGVVLGRCTADDVRAALAGSVPLGAYRGASAYPPPAQAAEAHVREWLGLTGQGDIAEVEQAGPGRWRVTLADGAHHRVDVREASGQERKESCRKPATPSRSWVAVVNETEFR